MNERKTLIITGGSSGIGRATAVLFKERGWRVYELSRHGVGAEGIEHIDCDVTRAGDCQSAVGQVLADADRIDVLICNAGMGISGPIEMTDDAAAHRLMEVNLHGAMHMVQAVLPQMRRQRGGRIVLVSSVASIFSIPYQAWYSASKAALNAMALALRNEVREHGIEVACLLPGDVRTGFTEARQKDERGVEIYPRMQRSVEAMERDERHGMAPEKIACRLWRMANSRHVAVYNVAGWGYKVLCFVERFLPRTLVNWVVGKLY